MVTKDVMALFVRVGVFTPVSWLNSQAVRHTFMVTSLQLSHSSLSPVTVPRVVAVNENVFSVNLPGKVTVK